MIIEKIYISFYIVLTDQVHFLVVFTSWDIRQYE